MIGYRKLMAFMLLLPLAANDNNRDLMNLLDQFWGQL